jgi:hypothetical protein
VKIVAVEAEVGEVASAAAVAEVATAVVVEAVAATGVAVDATVAATVAAAATDADRSSPLQKQKSFTRPHRAARVKLLLLRAQVTHAYHVLV